MSGELLVESFWQDGLEPHNKSLELISQVIGDVGATVDIGSEYRQYGSESISIRLTGGSGTNYRISVQFKRRIASLMTRRFAEMDFEDPSQAGNFMHPFRKMMEFDIHWYDFRDGDWVSICIHDRHDAPVECWPGDNIATTIQLLNDDIRSAMLPEMSTLRRELRSSYPVSWAAGQSSPEVKFSDVAKTVFWLRNLDDASSIAEFAEIREWMAQGDE